MAENSIKLPELDIKSLPGPETIRRTVLDNGIVVLARENFASPSVVVSGYLRVGALDESEAQAGLADMTAQSLMRGTASRSFGELYETIESIGATLGFGSGKHATSFSGKSLSEDLGIVLDMLAEVLQQPIFPEDPVNRVKAEKLTALAIHEQDTSSRAHRAFSQIVYKGHPYSIPSEGTKETVEQLEAANLREFHAGHYGAKGMVIAIVGAVAADDAIAEVAKRLGTWSDENGYQRPELPDVGQLEGTSRVFVKLEGKIQCDLVMGVPGPSRSHEHFLAAAIGNNILGRFGMYGRIGDAVREEAGLAYYAYSTVTGGHGPGPWEVVAGVNPANVEKTIELVRAEIDRYVREPVSGEELLENQANFIGRLPLQLESNEGVAGALIHAERYELGLDYYQRYPELIASVTPEQILDIGGQFLDSKNLGIGIAGPEVE
jgi:zinc protease